MAALLKICCTSWRVLSGMLVFYSRSTASGPFREYFKGLLES